jgi:TPR repeat protein
MGEMHNEQKQSDVGPDLYSQALSLLRADRDDEAFTLLHRGVNLGDASCQAMLGSIYAEGRGTITRDPTEASRLFELSTAQYNRHGTYIYGLVLFLGKGLPRDEQKGLRLIKRAALMGVAAAQAFLSKYYGQKLFQGTRAAAWLMVAAQNGDSEAREIARNRSSFPRKAQELAAEITGAITVLNDLLVYLDPDAAVIRLEEMVDEI